MKKFRKNINHSLNVLREILSNSEKKISNKDKLILLYNLLKLFPITDYFILLLQ